MLRRRLGHALENASWLRWCWLRIRTSACAGFVPTCPCGAPNTSSFEMPRIWGVPQQNYRRWFEPPRELSLAVTTPTAVNSASIWAISSSSPCSTAHARRHNCSMMRGQYAHPGRRKGQSLQSSIVNARPSRSASPLISQRAPSRTGIFSVALLPYSFLITETLLYAHRGAGRASLKPVLRERLPTTLATLRGPPATLFRDRLVPATMTVVWI